MANEGYIKLYRKMVQWGWYKETNTKAVFLHLLFMAQFEPCYFKGLYLEVGQVATSYREISLETGISERSVRTAIEHLKSTGELTQEASHKFSVFTLKNYSEYQGSDKVADRQLTSNRQTTDKRPTHSLNNKNSRIQEFNNSRNIKREKTSFDGSLEKLEQDMKLNDGVI